MRANIAFSRPVGACLVLLGLVALGGVAAAVAAADRSVLVEERDAKAGFVARSLAAGRPRDASGEGGAPEQGLAIDADSSTLAAAEVDALVRAAVVEAGGTVLSSRAEVKTGETVGGRNERIEVQAAVQGRIEALQATLFRLETGRPMVLVDELDLRSVEAEAGGGDAQSPVLAATLTLSAFWSRPRS